MVEALERHPACASACTTRGRCWTGSGANGRRSSSGPAGAGRSRAGRGARWRLLRAGPGVTAGRRPGRPAHSYGRRVEDTFGERPRGAWLAERVWEPDVPTSLVKAGYRLHHRGRCPLPRRRHPGGPALGPLLHRRPGLRLIVSRHRAGPALPHPLPAGRRGHRLPARARHAGRATGGHDG